MILSLPTIPLHTTTHDTASRTYRSGTTTTALAKDSSASSPSVNMRASNTRKTFTIKSCECSTMRRYICVPPSAAANNVHHIFTLALCTTHTLDILLPHAPRSPSSWSATRAIWATFEKSPDTRQRHVHASGDVTTWRHRPRRDKMWTTCIFSMSL